MGLSSTTNRVSYVGDASSTIFSFPYYFFTPSDLAVYLFDTTQSKVAAQTLNTHYTISGNVNSQGVYPGGGNVVMNSAFPSALQIIITRAPSPIQNFVLNQNGPINSLALVQQLDYLTTLVQRLQDEVSRSAQINDGLGTINGTFNTTLPQTILLNSSAGAPLIINSGATGFDLGLVATSGSGAVSYLGTLPVSNGGTGQAGGLTPFGVWYSASGSSMAQTAAGPIPQLLTGQGGASAPVWALLNLQSSVVGTLQVGTGGTGTGTSYIQYGVVFASSATQMANTAQGGTDQVFIGQGAAAPIFSTVNLSSGSSVRNALSASFGGTGLSSFSPQYGVIYASNSTTMSIVPSAATDTLLTAQGSSAPIFSTVSLGSSAGIVGILPIAKGGTAAATANAAFVNISPLATRGDIIIAGSAAVQKKLAVGSDGLVLTADSTQTDGIVWAAAGGAALALSTKTAAYNAATTDGILVAGSGCGTINLYGTTGNSGKLLRVKKTSVNFNVVTIAGSAATIDGSSAITLNTVNESVELFCDGTNWNVQNRSIPSQWNAYPSGPNTNPPGWGSSVIQQSMWRRDGQNMDILVRLKNGTIQATNAQIEIAGSSQLTIASWVNSSLMVGNLAYLGNSANQTYVLCFAGQNFVQFGTASASGAGITPGTGSGVLISNIEYSIKASIPIQGWGG